MRAAAATVRQSWQHAPGVFGLVIDFARNTSIDGQSIRLDGVIRTPPR